MSCINRAHSCTIAFWTLQMTQQMGFSDPYLYKYPCKFLISSYIIFKLRSVQPAGMSDTLGFRTNLPWPCWTMSRYSAQILIGFITYIFQFAIRLWVGLGTWHFRTVTVPSAIVIVIDRLLIRQSNRPACLAWAKVQQGENTLWHLCHRTGETDRWNGCNSYQ